MLVKRKYRDEMKHLLSYIPALERLIDLRQAYIDDLNDEDGIGAVSYDAFPIAKTYTIKDKVGEVALMKEEAITHLRKEIEGYERHIKRIKDAIEALSEQEREVIERYFFKQHPEKDIADDMFVTLRTVQRVKSRATATLAFIYFGTKALDGVDAEKMNNLIS